VDDLSFDVDEVEVAAGDEEMEVGVHGDVSYDSAGVEF
jgi:hypothetical protein